MNKVIVFLFGLALGIAIASPPDCPTEDSCIAQYFNGSWHIIQVTP